MPPQNTPNQMPEMAIPEKNQESESTTTNVEQSPEIAPLPISPEIPKTETFSDQQTVSQPITPVPTPTPEPEIIEATPELEAAEQNEVDKSVDIDKNWVDAIDNIVEKDKDKPYEEEEDAEKLNINYQQKAFGKQISKESEE